MKPTNNEPPHTEKRVQPKVESEKNAKMQKLLW